MGGGADGPVHGGVDLQPLRAAQYQLLRLRRRSAQLRRSALFESTVIDMSGSVPTILRPGKITAEEIEKVIGLEVYTDDTILQEAKPDLRPGSPGMKYRHYAPKAPMIILKGKRENIEKEIEYRKATFDGKLGIILFDWDKPEEAAHDFYRALRKMDEERVDLILAGAVSTEGLGLAVMNRMLKSAAHQVLEV